MPTDEERMAFKRQEREAAASIMAGDRYCPDPSAHEHRAASQERPSIDVEQIVRAALRVVDQDTPLSVGEPLIQKAIRYATNLSRLSAPVGE